MEVYRLGRVEGKKRGQRSAPARVGIVFGQICHALGTRHRQSLQSLSSSLLFIVKEGVWATYADILALAPQQAQSVAVRAMSGMFPRFERSGILLRAALVIFSAQEIWALRAERVFDRTLPRLQEQRLGALSGAGQKGIGSVALGQTAKYCWMKSWYSQE